jgi:hypothetical protein
MFTKILLCGVHAVNSLGTLLSLVNMMSITSMIMYARSTGHVDKFSYRIFVGIIKVLHYLK